VLAEGQGGRLGNVQCRVRIRGFGVGDRRRVDGEVGRRGGGGAASTVAGERAEDGAGEARWRCRELARA
jgi:hypothetical protein